MADTQALSGKTILVLEDDFYQAHDMQFILQDAGADIVGPFRDGASAMRAADENRPDCAVLDLNLGDGPTLEPIRGLHRRGVPILIVTGYDGDILPEDLRDLPCIQKPTEAHRVISQVRALLLPKRD